MRENIKYMLENWFKWDRKSLFYFFVRVPALVFQPIVTAYIPKAMIDCITKGVSTERLIAVIGGLSLLLTLTIWLDPFMNELILGGARIVRMRYAVAAFEKNLRTDYVNIENLEMREKQKRAEVFYNGRWSGGANFIARLNQFFVAVVGVIASSVLIYKINIFMILLIIATCGAQFCIQRALTKKQHENLNKRSGPATKFDYFYKLSKDGTAAKDIELYKLSDFFVKALADSLCKIEKIYAKYTHTCVAFDGVTALLNAVREAIAYIYLAYLTTKGELGVSDFIFYFGIITGFSSWVLSLGYSVNQIETDCNECKAYREYIESEDTAEQGDKLTEKSVDGIEFENVSFKYPSANVPTLKNIKPYFKNLLCFCAPILVV